MSEAERINFLNSVRWHRDNCKDSECNVSLFMLRLLYARLVGRELTKKEAQENF